MFFMLTLFRKKTGKWHEVRWCNGQRDIYLALRFAPDGSNAPPALEKLLAKPGIAESPALPSDVLREVKAAVDEYNRRNLCALRIGAIRYRASATAEASDHGMAARKLLNLL